ncbi:MAG: hypothetical protein SGPRY_010204 [Prymnesium sp.]
MADCLDWVQELQRAIAPVRVLTYVNSMLSDPAEDGGEKRADRGFLGARTHSGQGVRMMAACLDADDDDDDGDSDDDDINDEDDDGRRRQRLRR